MVGLKAQLTEEACLQPTEALGEVEQVLATALDVCQRMQVVPTPLHTLEVANLQLTAAWAILMAVQTLPTPQPRTIMKLQMCLDNTLEDQTKASSPLQTKNDLKMFLCV